MFHKEWHGSFLKVRW